MRDTVFSILKNYNSRSNFQTMKVQSIQPELNAVGSHSNIEGYLIYCISIPRLPSWNSRQYTWGSQDVFLPGSNTEVKQT